MATNNATNTGNLTDAGDGKILIARAAGNAIAANITPGTGITVTNGTNSISIASNGANLVVDQTTGSVTMAINNTYITDAGASLVTYTLPAVAAIGSFFEIVGGSAGGWVIAQGTGQIIHFGNVSSTLTTGTLASSNQYDCVKLRCIVANTTFAVQNAQGNITIV